MLIIRLSGYQVVVIRIPGYQVLEDCLFLLISGFPGVLHPDALIT